jgi:hypothetical protein
VLHIGLNLKEQGHETTTWAFKSERARRRGFKKASLGKSALGRCVCNQRNLLEKKYEHVAFVPERTVPFEDWSHLTVRGAKEYPDNWKEAASETHHMFLSGHRCVLKAQRLVLANPS